MTQIGRTNLASRFGIVRDVRPVADPWGIGIIFQLERGDSRAHQAYVEAKAATNPVLRKFEIATAKGTVAAMAESLQKEGFDHELLTAKTLEAAKLLDFTSEELEALKPDVVGSIARRVKGWSGLKDEDTGEDVPYSAEVTLELLTSTAWVEEGLPFGGQPLGVALCQFLSQESAKHAEYRQGVIADSGKGSGPTPAGSTTTSGVSTDSSV